MSLLITALSLLVLALFLARAIRKPKGFRYPDHLDPPNPYEEN